MTVNAPSPLELRTSEIRHTENDQSLSIVFPNAATTLGAPPRSRLFINPLEALGESCRKEWLKLHDELRLLILKHNLVFDRPLCSYHHAYPTDAPMPGQDTVMTNGSRCFSNTYPWLPKFPLLPKRCSIRTTFFFLVKFSHTRHYALESSCERFHQVPWFSRRDYYTRLGQTKKLVSRASRFTNLRYVEVLLLWTGILPSAQEWATVIKPITFTCK
jgi:hypothetical protein